MDDTIVSAVVRKLIQDAIKYKCIRQSSSDGTAYTYCAHCLAVRLTNALGTTPNTVGKQGVLLVHRFWAMPSQWTFQIPIVKKILAEEMSGTWADPFSGKHSPAQIRNDCNEANEAEFHLDGLEFLKQLDTASMDGVIFDPPYSVEQALRCYRPKFKGTAGRAEYWAKCKDEIQRIVKVGGKAICFGWDSTGIGKKRGFNLLRCALLCHGACHNDTIITIEVKSQSPTDQAPPTVTRS